MRIYINQAGYLPKSKKIAVLAEEVGILVGKEEKKIQVFDQQGTCVLEKTAVYFGEDISSGDKIWQVDFSELEEEGKYQIKDEQANQSYMFKIDSSLYKDVNQLLCKALYFQRCGMPLEEPYAGVFKRESCHEEKAVLLEDYLKIMNHEVAKEEIPYFDVRGGWHDAGDYGRYTTAAATALAHILYAFTWFPKSFQHSLMIPESGNGVEDILNECLYELKWMLKMQMEDGSVCHKLTSMRHANFVMPCKDKRQLILFPASTMATGAFVAIMAKASRVYADIDQEFSKEAFSAAKKAWAWLEEHPEFIGFKNPEGCNTGEYEDNDDKDERLWALTELYLCTGEETYIERAKVLFEEVKEKTALGWSDVGGFAGWALLEEEIKSAREHKIPVVDEWKKESRVCESIAKWKRQYIDLIIQEAERWIKLSDECGYMASMSPEDYGWGSNMVLLNRGMILGVAYLLSGRIEFLYGATKQMDYLLGVNATGYSYVTGVGEHPFKNPHNRVTVADGIEETIKGFVSGGANKNPVDEKAEWLIEPELPPMKCFLDVWECYSLNEITIYWNSPAIFLAGFLDSLS